MISIYEYDSVNKKGFEIIATEKMDMEDWIKDVPVPFELFREVSDILREQYAG